jgi:peptidyl-prolyl cis-trans isomerase C
MVKAKARHILVETREKCEDLKRQIEGGADFAQMAKKHSKCPSGKDGGSLGEFSPGEMVEAFDKIVFSEEIGKVHGPIETEFGFHLIEITSRTE